MANRRIKIEKLPEVSTRKEIIRLGSELSLSNRTIARALKVSRPVVAQYLSDFKATGLSYSEVRGLSHDELLELISRNKRLGNRRYELLLERFVEDISMR